MLSNPITFATFANTREEGALLIGVSQLAVSDENKVEVDTKPSGAYSTDLSKSAGKGYSPGAER